LGGIYADVDSYIQTDDFLKMMQGITGIPDLRYDPWYYGAGTHENFHGAGLEAHYDFNIHPNTAFHRRMNAIIYLNQDWQDGWGGEVCFHTDPWDMANDQKVAVKPEFNRCVVFETTEKSWHSVTPVSLPEDQRHRSRKSFTIYLYTPTRPPQETAVEHGTVYVPPPLSDTIREGRTLSAQDMEEITLNMARRHSYLKQMYKREYRFSAVIEDLKRQIEDWKKVVHIPVLGRAKQLSVSEALYGDGWMGHGVRFRIRLLQAIGGLTVNLWRQSDVTNATGVLVSVNGAEARFHVDAGDMTSLRFDQAFAEGEELEISVQVDTVREASEQDKRQISFVLDSIDLG